MWHAIEQRLLYHPLPGSSGNWEYGHYRQVGTSNRVFFMCHGNMGNARQRLAWVGIFGEGHYYIHEYAGFGSRYGLDELSRTSLVHRANMALATIHTGPLYLIGESLGTGIVCELATRYYPRGIVLLTPYSTMTAMAHRVIPILGPLLLQDRYNTVHYLRMLQRLPHPPWISVVAGRSDSIIPASQTRQVAKAGTCSVLWYTGDHDDLFRAQVEWLPAVTRLLSRSDVVEQ